MNTVPVHVEQRRAQQLGHVIAFIELGRVEHFIPQRIRHRLIGFVMACIVSKYRRMAGPVLVDLRRELHEITRRVGARERGVTLGGKQAVQGVDELVEQDDDIVPREERRLSIRWLLIVADVINYWPRGEF